MACMQLAPCMHTAAVLLHMPAHVPGLRRSKPHPSRHPVPPHHVIVVLCAVVQLPLHTMVTLVLLRCAARTRTLATRRQVESLCNHIWQRAPMKHLLGAGASMQAVQPYSCAAVTASRVQILLHAGLLARGALCGDHGGNGGICCAQLYDQPRCYTEGTTPVEAS
jgi:hypothetical protein